MGSLSRRRFLQLSTAAAATAAVGAACSTSDDGDTGTATTTSASTTTTALTQQRRARLSDIDHVVILFQDSSSFDQIFGTRKDSRGFGDPDVLLLPNEQPIWYQPSTNNAQGFVLPFAVAPTSPTIECGIGLDHGWADQHAAWNSGLIDGYTQQMGPLAMGYYRREDLRWYYGVADEFTSCDSWFCSVLGGSDPNRYYAMTGDIDPHARNGGPAIDDSGRAYSWETYPERLHRAGISWRIYRDAEGHGNNVIGNFVQFHEAKDPDPLWDSGIRSRTVSQFVADCAADSLPQVSWIVPPRSSAGAPPPSAAVGQAFAKQHVDAIAANPKVWAKTLFILSFDDNGGFFDHVPPPVPEPDTPDEFVGTEPIGLGARVPGLIVSPWSRGGKVNSDVFDHTSTLRFLEQRFGVEVPAISEWRRDTCGDLLSTLDFKSFDDSIPKLPATVSPPQAIGDICNSDHWPVPPEQQVVPTVET